MTTIKHLDHLNLSVANFEQTVKWYSRVFGFALVEEGVRQGIHWGVIRSGDAMLCIYEHPDFKFEDYEAAAKAKRHYIAHFGLRVTDKKNWEATIKREQVEVGMTWRYPNSDSWYVYDPTGHEIEVACWDEDKVRFEPMVAA